MITMTLEGHKEMGIALGKMIKGVNDKKTIIKEVVRPAAKIVTKVMRQKAPKLKGYPSFNVYRTPKLKSGTAAPKGMGKIYVKIKPGQLRKSIFHFSTPATRKAGALNVGPRYKKGVWAKPEKGGWYMHMVQFGAQNVKPQPFVMPALLATRKGAGNLMQIGMKRVLKNTAAKTGGKIEIK